MEVNPYLATTGGLFGLSWETDLNKSYVMSQQIYIDCIYGAWCLPVFPGSSCLESNPKLQGGWCKPNHQCVFITAVSIIKLFAWGGWEGGGHVLQEMTSRGLWGLVCPSRTSERGGEGYCVKEGGEEEGERARERAVKA